MKLYTVLNMHYPITELFARPEITLRNLRKSAIECKPDLDQNVVELTIDVPDPEIRVSKDYIKDYALLEPGLIDNGHQWVYKGEPLKITNTRTVGKAKLPIIEDIPRVSIVAVVDREALASAHWWLHPDVTAAIERYKPKWGAKGYVFNKIGNDKVRVDYIPLTVNPTALATMVTSLMSFVEGVLTEQLPAVITDHGSQQEFMDLL